ncbi:hypothetical protein AAG570_003067 [Ranatra chinensis]|uniref:Transmembrane protein 127 transmembrane region domain-containing protein n=1 Tax=Ranatra chinensis TaxID=642074 RepID=A0ABD0Y5S8_9HEMI
MFATAGLVKLDWFRVLGEPLCTPRLALYHLLRIGYFTIQPMDVHHQSTQLFEGRAQLVTSSPIIVEYRTGTQVLRCVTPEVLNLLRVLVVLCVISVFCSMIGFCLDLIGPKKKSLRFIRRNALPGICTVMTVVVIVGVCYLVSRALEFAVLDMYPGASARISYDYGCYSLTVAGVVSLLATACNLLQDPAPGTDSSSWSASQRRRLIEDFDGSETFSVGMLNLPPPPPYTP